ncbi:PAS domain S-box-containing protein [Pontibacter mucosus]|uniref:Oxygen sensor histidine kinase NreB n=1 Tax=Pontibacter mucosus TaxID=1649266 RepID=A0A2T5YCR4_9BACT|nr:PAS domain-containing protein [Pontibacter mucosus]PTX14262.1 PAS domain S-box-containing protein [Pontibacter mucosus]
MNITAKLPVATLKALEKVPDLYLVLSPDLEVLTASDALLTAMSASRKSMAGKSVADIFTVGNATTASAVEALLNEAVQKALGHEVPQHISLLQSRTAQLWRVQPSPVTDEAGAILYTILKLTPAGRREHETQPNTVDKYHTLFNSINQGFCILELYFDEHQKPVDYRYLEVNPAFKQHTSIKNAQGKTIRELLPGIEPFWIEQYGQVALTGQPIRLVEEVHDLGIWFDVYAFRIGNPDAHHVAVLFSNITEKRKAEEALRESEDRFRTVVNLVPDMLWINNADGAISWYSQRWYEYTGLSEQDSIGYGWLKSLHPDDQKHAWHNFTKAAEEARPLRQEYRIRDAAGGYRWFLVQALPIKDKEGRALQWFGAATDIHEHKLAEEVIANHNALLEQEVSERTEAMQESKELLASVLENTSSNIMVLKAIRDSNGEIMDFEYVLTNSNLLRAATRDSLVGRKFGEEAPGVLPAALQANFKEVVELGHDWTGEAQVRFEHREVWSQVYARKFDDGVLVTYFDITQLKEAERELRDNTMFIEQIMDATPDFIMVFNLQTNKVDFVNRSAYLGNEFRFHETLSLDYAKILERAHPQDRKPLHRFIERFRTAADGQVYSLEYRVLQEGKTVWYRTRGKVFKRDAAGTPTHYISVVQDISALKQLEAENTRMRLDQQKALLLAILQAQEEERRRISEALHNGVGQQLYAAKIHLDLLHGQGTAPDPKAVAALAQVDHILKQAINQTRSLSHELTPAVLGQFGLEAAFHDIANSLSSKTLKLQCVVANLPKNLDKNLQIVLYRIAQELANNVLKHARATAASLLLRNEDDTLILTAEDNGVGFDPAKLPAKGIGLSSIQDRVKLLNGSCSLSSSPGQGTSVEVRLPLHPLSLQKV